MAFSVRDYIEEQKNKGRRTEVVRLPETQRDRDLQQKRLDMMAEVKARQEAREAGQAPRRSVNAGLRESGESRDAFDSRVRTGYREQLEQAERDRRIMMTGGIGPMMQEGMQTIREENGVAKQEKPKQEKKRYGGSWLDILAMAGGADTTLPTATVTPEAVKEAEATAVGGTLAGAGKDYLGSLVSGAGTLMQTANKNNPANQAAQIIANMQGADAPEVVKRAAEKEVAKNEATAKNAQAVRQLGKNISAAGQAQMQQAKVGQSARAQATLDVLGAGSQMVMDIGLGALTGLGMMVPMAARVFGSSAEKKADKGASLEQQVTYGIAAAGVAYALEKITNVAFKGLKIINPGIADDVLEKAINKMAQKLASGPKGATVLKAVASLATAAGGEGLEELLEAFIDPYLQRITGDKNAKSIFQDPELMSEALYSAFLGFVLGGIGGNVNLSINTILETGASEDLREAYRQYLSFYTDEAVNEAYAAMKENGMFSSEAAEAMKKTNQKLQRMMPKTEQRAAQNRAGITVAAQVDEKGENKAAGAAQQPGNIPASPAPQTAQSGPETGGNQAAQQTASVQQTAQARNPAQEAAQQPGNIPASPAPQTAQSAPETGGNRVKVGQKRTADELAIEAQRIIGENDGRAAGEIIREGMVGEKTGYAYLHAEEISKKVSAGGELTWVDLYTQMELNEMAARETEYKAAADEGRQEAPDAVDWEQEQAVMAAPTKTETAPAATEAAEAVSTEPAPVMAGQEGVEYAGEDRVSGDRGRRTGAAAGEPGRRVAQSTGRRQNREVQNIRGRSRADDVSFAYEHAGAEPVSTRDLYGDERGSEEADLREAPRSVIESDEELRGLDSEIRQAGYEPHFFTGMARLKSGQPCPAYFDGKRAFIRIDHPKWTATELWDHEKFHGIKDKDPGIVDRIWTQLAKTTDREQMQNALKVYRDRYHGAYDVDAEGDTVWNVDVMEKIVEEILADAYAGRDAFGTGVEDYTETVREMAGQTEEETAEARGPPEGRFAVTVDMTEEERYFELSKKNIEVATDANYDEYASDIQSLEALKAKAKGQAEKVIYPLAQKLGILNRPLRTPELEIDFNFSKNNGLAESVSKQLRYGGSYADFAKALINLDKILENAVVIERHGDKYKGTERENRNLVDTSVLLGLFADGETIIPVQMEIKNTANTGGHLYMTVTMTKIEADVLGSRGNQVDNVRSLIPASEYKIADIFANVNPEDKHFLKYVPDKFLGEEQIDAKYAALAEDAERLAEMKAKSAGSFAVDAAEETPAQRLRNEAEQYMPEGVTDRYRKEGAREQPEQPWWIGEDEEIRKAAEMMAERNRRDPAFDVDEYLQRKRQEAEAERARRLRNVPKTEFEGTEAMNKLGIRVEGSVANYAAADQIRKRHSAARSIQKELRKAEKRLGATAEERIFAGHIAGGTLTEGMIPDGVRRDVVMELADYYMAERAQGIDMIREKRAEINRTLDERMANLFKDTDKYDPSPIIVLNNRTPQRNMLKIFGDKMGKRINEEIFDPVATNEAERIRFINRQLDQVRTFADSNGKQSRLNKDERALVQMMIEGRAVEEIVAGMEMGGAIQRLGKSIVEGADNGDGLQAVGLNGKERDLAKKYARWLQTQEALQSDSVDSVKVANAADKYSQLFDQYYDAINDFLVVHGYEPIGFIKGYAPHLQPEDNMNLLDKTLQTMGLNRSVTNLPTEIAGRTSEFKPSKRWNPYFLSRTGDETRYDIAEAFESYVDHLSDVLYHTDDIMRLRRMELFFRKAYSKEELGEQIDWAEHLREMKPEERLDALRDAGLVGKTTNLSPEDMAEVIEKYVEENFAKMEDVTKYGEFVVWLQNYANILAGKQSMVDRGGEAGAGRRILNWGNRLTSMFGKAQVAGNLSSVLNQTSQLPMILAENGTRNTLRAARDMMKGDLRRAFADESDVLTGKAGIQFLVHTPGEMIIDTMFTPAQWMDTLVSSLAVRGAYLKAVNSGMSHEDAIKAADRYGRNVMGSREKGVKPLGFHAKNPLSQLLHVFQVEALNNWEHVSQDLHHDFQQIAEEHGKRKAAAALAGVIIKTFLSAFLLNRLTEETYGGTPAPFDFLGMTSNFIASGRGLNTNEWLMKVIDDGMEQLTGERSLGTERMDRSEFDTEAAFADLVYNISNEIPFWSNASSLLGLGDQTLPWPDLVDTGKELIEAVSEDGLLSGSTAQAAAGVAGEFLPGGRQMVKTIGGIQSAVRGGKATGYGDDMALQFPTEQSPGNIARQVLFGVNATPEAKNYRASGNSKLSVKQTQLWKRLKDGGADSEDVYDTIHAWREVTGNKELDSLTRSALQRNMVRHMDMTDDQKLDMYRTLSGADSRCDKFQRMMDAGMTFDQVMDAYERHEELDNDESLKASDKAAQFVQWAYMELDQEAANAAITELAFYTTMKAAPSQAALEEQLNQTSLTKAQKAAIWDSYGWKKMSPWG